MYQLVVIGGSAGALDVILQMIPSLDKHLQIPVVIVLHRKPSNDDILVKLLAWRTKLIVKEAEEKEFITHGTIYVAPPDYHLLIEQNKSFSLDVSEKINYSRPSIDVTFQSAANVYGSSVACILLSGSNDDGVEGLRTVKRMKGLTVVQDPLTAAMAFMPQQAINEVSIDLILDQDRLKDFINELDKADAGEYRST